MVKVSVVVGALMSVAAAMTVSATKINFINKCSNGVQLYHSERFEKLEKLADIDSGKSYSKDVTGHAHMFRDGFDTDATCTYPLRNDLDVPYLVTHSSLVCR